VEIVGLLDPIAILDKFLVHQRNLPGRAAKIDQANPPECAHKVSKARVGTGKLSDHINSSTVPAMMQGLGNASADWPDREIAPPRWAHPDTILSQICPT
jgi:hypothetical protein